MDAVLIKEREAFRKRALAQPTVEKKPRKDDTSKKPAKPPSKCNTNRITLIFSFLSEELQT